MELREAKASGSRLDRVIAVDNSTIDADASNTVGSTITPGASGDVNVLAVAILAGPTTESARAADAFNLGRGRHDRS